jgi:putative ABC transport system ATP-binding protein
MAIEPAVDARHVRRVFAGPDGPVVALADVDLAVRHGTMVAVRGRSGSGKTTLLNLIGALDRPTSGEIIVLGERVTGLGPEEAAQWRAGNLGFVFQAHALMPMMSALENVDLALRIAGVDRKARRQLARRHLAEVGLGARAHHRPSELSGGERQRVAVARAVAAGNRLIIADEPTAGLDSAAAASVFELLRSLVDERGITVVLATHDPLTDAYVDGATHLERGVLTSDPISG